jgi:hypothetical protein
MGALEEMAMAAMRFKALVHVSVMLAGVLAAGCASLDERAVAQTQRLEEGEFYAWLGAGVRQAADAAALLPVSLDPELATALGYGHRAAAFTPILMAMNTQLERNACCRYVAVASLPSGAPYVFVGSADSEFAPPEAQQQVLPHEPFAPIVMYVRKPSAAWSEAMAALLAREGATYAVVTWLGVSQYPKGREGAFGKKVVLGTGHEEPIRFLTAEDKLLEVLQLTGVLVDARGNVVRAGAEGVVARDTPFAAQVFDVSKVLDDRTLGQVLTSERRQDLPGAPHKWEVALGNLLAQLRGDRAGLRVP